MTLADRFSGTGIIPMIKPYQYYINKYLATPFSNKRYKLCFSPRYKFLWFRVAKCGSRTINKHLKELAGEDYVYTSPIGYLPGMFKDYLKIAFVRDPVARFISAWKDKVVKQNYFRFSSEIHDKMQNIDNFIDYVEGSDRAFKKLGRLIRHKRLSKPKKRGRSFFSVRKRIEEKRMQENESFLIKYPR